MLAKSTNLSGLSPLSLFFKDTTSVNYTKQGLNRMHCNVIHPLSALEILFAVMMVADLVATLRVTTFDNLFID